VEPRGGVKGCSARLGAQDRGFVVFLDDAVAQIDDDAGGVDGDDEAERCRKHRDNKKK
jgi:hypothetical protein